MADPYLMALMRGEIKQEKKDQDEFDIAADQMLEKYVKTLEESKLDSLEARKLKLSKELKFAELEEPTISGLKYLMSHEADAAMVDQFLEAKHRLEELDLETFKDLDSWSDCISQEVLDAISNRGVEAYHQGEFEICLSLYALLTTFKQESGEYWLKLGISALKSADFNLALKSFDQALKKDPNLFEAHLFSAECYLNKGLVENAKQELEAVQTTQFDEVFSRFKEELGKSCI